jgi:hypothetical protein
MMRYCDYIGLAQDEMRNPWTTRISFMGVELDSANEVMGSAHGQTTAAPKRQVVSIQAATSPVDDADQ